MLHCGHHHHIQSIQPITTIIKSEISKFYFWKNILAPPPHLSGTLWPIPCNTLNHHPYTIVASYYLRDYYCWVLSIVKPPPPFDTSATIVATWYPPYHRYRCCHLIPSTIATDQNHYDRCHHHSTSTI